jgi:hypothetical protein
VRLIVTFPKRKPCVRGVGSERLTNLLSRVGNSAGIICAGTKSRLIARFAYSVLKPK